MYPAVQNDNENNFQEEQRAHCKVPALLGFAVPILNQIYIKFMGIMPYYMPQLEDWSGHLNPVEWMDIKDELRSGPRDKNSTHPLVITSEI